MPTWNVKLTFPAVPATEADEDAVTDLVQDKRVTVFFDRNVPRTEIQIGVDAPDPASALLAAFDVTGSAVEQAGLGELTVAEVLSEREYLARLLAVPGALQRLEEAINNGD